MSPLKVLVAWVFAFAVQVGAIFLVPMARPAPLVEMAEAQAKVTASKGAVIVTADSVLWTRSKAGAREVAAETLRDTGILSTFWCLAAWYLSRDRSVKTMAGTVAAVLLGMLPGLVLFAVRMSILAGTGAEPGPASFEHVPFLGAALNRLTVDSVLWAFLTGRSMAGAWHRSPRFTVALAMGLTVLVKVWPYHLHLG